MGYSNARNVAMGMRARAMALGMSKGLPPTAMATARDTRKPNTAAPAIHTAPQKAPPASSRARTRAQRAALPPWPLARRCSSLSLDSARAAPVRQSACQSAGSGSSASSHIHTAGPQRQAARQSAREKNSAPVQAPRTRFGDISCAAARPKASAAPNVHSRARA